MTAAQKEAKAEAKKPSVDDLYNQIDALEKENRRLSLANEQMEDEVATQKERADRLATRQADKVDESVVWAAVGKFARNWREGVAGESEALAEACHRAEQVKQLVAEHERNGGK